MRDSGRRQELSARLPSSARPAFPGTFDCVERSELKALRALVVDDDVGDMALVTRALRRMVRYECQVTTVSSLTAARRLLATDTPDILLVDYTLEGECGIDLVKEVASRTPNLPILLVTGLWTPEIEHEVLAHGGVACLSKDNLTPQVTETVIRQAMDCGMLRSELERSMGPATRDEPDREHDIPRIVLDAIGRWREAALSKHYSVPEINIRLGESSACIRLTDAEASSARSWIATILDGWKDQGRLDITVREHPGLGEISIACAPATLVKLFSSPARDTVQSAGASNKKSGARGTIGDHHAFEASPADRNRSSLPFPSSRGTQRSSDDRVSRAKGESEGIGFASPPDRETSRTPLMETVQITARDFAEKPQHALNRRGEDD